jgi:hypothetical protein
MKSFRIPLRVVFYREEGRWVAHCLEFDLCGDGVTRDEALNSLNEGMRIQIDESIKHNNPRNLFSPAPGEVWEKFFAGKDVALAGLPVTSERVEPLTFEHSEYREYAETDAVALKE